MTGKIPDKDSNLGEQFPNPRPFKVKDEDENMNAYTRVQVAEVDVHLQTDEPFKQADKSVALTLDQLRSTSSIAAYLAQIWGISEEDCSIILENLYPILRKAYYPEDNRPRSPPREATSFAEESIRNPLNNPMMGQLPKGDETFFLGVGAEIEDDFLDDFEDSYFFEFDDLPSRRESAGEQQQRLQNSQIVESIPAIIKLTNGNSRILFNPRDFL
ncbi:hypothetical protein V8C34DRAFT_308822 [Trichoderma compactum]